VCVCVFQGEIQQLLIAPDPRAAADYCHTHIPDCDSALMYNSLSLDPVEVTPPTAGAHFIHIHQSFCIDNEYETPAALCVSLIFMSVLWLGLELSVKHVVKDSSQILYV